MGEQRQSVDGRKAQRSANLHRIVGERVADVTDLALDALDKTSLVPSIDE